MLQQGDKVRILRDVQTPQDTFKAGEILTTVRAGLLPAFESEDGRRLVTLYYDPIFERLK